MPLFINADLHTKSQRRFITNNMALQPPMGVGSVAGYLRDRGKAEVRVVDEILRPLDNNQLRFELNNLDNPRMVCISSVTIQFARALQLARLIKSFDRDIKVLFGGILPIDNARFNIATPYPGTKLHQIAKEEGKLNVGEGYHNFSVQYYIFGDKLPYVPNGTDLYGLIFDTMWANLRFYFRMRTLKRFRKSALTGGGTINIPESFSVSHVLDIGKFSVLIGLRFLYVSIRMLLRSAVKKLKHLSRGLQTES